MAAIDAHQPAPGTIRLTHNRKTVTDLTAAQARTLQHQLGDLLDQNTPRRPPRIQLLGPVHLLNTTGRQPQSPARTLELITVLALHPWPTSELLDAAMWPDTRVTATKRNGPVTQARGWLGTAADGHPYLCHIDQGGYALAEEVRTDWQVFLELTADHTPASLIRALRLVTGQPVTGINPTRYAWAESDRQEMIVAVCDAAHTLANRALADGDSRTAAWAAAKGTMADPGSERLWRDALHAAQHDTDPSIAARIAEQGRAALEPLDDD